MTHPHPRHLAGRFNAPGVPAFMALAALLIALLLAGAGAAQEVLIRNVAIFDGQQQALIPARNVLVRGNTIARISEQPIEAPDAIVIDGTGRTLMPGLTDAHWHSMMSDIPQAIGLSADIGYINQVATVAARRTLMRGFTTVRDVGGPVFGLKRAIDEGIAVGPRIYPSGAMISQTSGHADYRSVNDLPADSARALTYHERIGMMSIVDGVPEMLRRVRENLMRGATQIKLMAGGGVASYYDPLDTTQFTFDEMKAAVEAAAGWNTYVMVHAYTANAMQQAIGAGVQSIEHGNLMDEDTARMMADKGIWLSLQPFLDDEDAIPFPEGSASRAKQMEMVAGTDTAYRLAIKHGLKVAFGTDTLFSAALADRQGAQLAKLTRWYEPWEVLRMATSGNFGLLKMSGPRDPYPGVNGVVTEGALADLLLVQGDPLANIDLIADPENNFVLIMKDGVIYKDTTN